MRPSGTEDGMGREEENEGGDRQSQYAAGGPQTGAEDQRELQARGLACNPDLPQDGQARPAGSPQGIEQAPGEAAGRVQEARLPTQIHPCDGVRE